LLTVGLDDLAENKAVVMVGAVVLIVLMTAVCVTGIDVSARVQNVLIIAQVLALLVFAVVALVRVYNGDASADALSPSWGWLDPFSAGGSALTGGLLLGVFAYWGWESAVNLTEETEDPASAPGRAAIVSTLLLLVTYLSVAYAIVAFSGTDLLTENAEEEEFIFGLIATEVLGGWDWILLFAVATSAVASTQTTIIPASRTAFSMARRHAAPPMFGKIHARFRTPDVSTWWVAAIASVWYVVVNLISENALFDSLTALSLLIAFYYALTGIACAVYHRRQLTDSVRNFVLIGVGPVLGAVLLLWLLIESIRDMADPAASYSGQAWFGLGPPLVIACLIFVTGLVLMLVWRRTDGRYWREQATVAPPELVGPGSSRGER
jgi:amino acid transporter